MIAIDTNALRRYLRGSVDSGTATVARAVISGDAVLPPVVLTEALSDPAVTQDEVRRTLRIALMPLLRGYWFRAGNLRRRVKQRGLSAPTPDCLIAQVCIDLDVPLLTYDEAFTRYIEDGLKLL